jgi:hypothetical protein
MTKGATATTANEIDEKKAQRYVGEIERCLDELLSMRGSYMAECKEVRERISDWKSKADDDGVPRAALNAALKERELVKKLAAVTADMQDDAKALVQQLRRKLKPVAELPLFGAAIAQAERKAAEGAKGKAGISGADLEKAMGADDDVGDPRPRFLREKDRDAPPTH